MIDFDREGDAKSEKFCGQAFNEKHLRFETSMTKKLTDFELDLKIENGKQLIFLQAHHRSSMVRFNFSQMVWDFSLTNMVGFGLSIYALHF